MIVFKLDAEGDDRYEVYKSGGKGSHTYKIITYKNIDYGLPSSSGDAMFITHSGELLRSGFRRVITK